MPHVAVDDDHSVAGRQQAPQFIRDNLSSNAAT
jgi:hypothetical protein